MIYFFQEEDDGPIKIGHSSDPLTRRGQLQTGNPRELKTLGVMVGNVNVESQLHEQFAPYRIRGEWFESVPVIINFIARHCTPGKLNSVSLLDNGDYSITFYTPMKASLDLLLLTGAYRDLQLIGDKKPEWFQGIQGPCSVLKCFLRECGVSEEVLREFHEALLAF